MTTNDRPDYLAQTLRSWEKVRGDKKFLVRAEPHQPTLDVLKQADLDMEVVVNRQRLGVKENPRALLADALARDEFVVYTEDDVIVADDVLEYMEWAKDRYKDVLCILANQRWWRAADEWAVRRSQAFTCLTFGVWREWGELMLASFDLDPRGWDWSIVKLIRDAGLQTIAPDFSRSQHIGRRGTHMVEELWPESQSRWFRPEYEPGGWAEVGNEIVD